MGLQSFGAAVAMCLVACVGNPLPASAQDKQEVSETSFRAIY